MHEECAGEIKHLCVCVCLHEYVGVCVQRRKTEERERGNR